MTLPKVAVIGTGGTISGSGADRLDFYEYGTSGRFMQLDEVLATVPELSRVAEIAPIHYRNVGSGSIGPADWLELLRLIQGAAAAHPDLAGVVVTHGTASLEETAWFLNLAVRAPVAVGFCCRCGRGGECADWSPVQAVTRIGQLQRLPVPACHVSRRRGAAPS